MPLVYNPKMETRLWLRPVRPNFHRTFFAPHPSAELSLAVRHFAVFFYSIQLTEGEPFEYPPVVLK
jgi:hypothetical protein